LAIVLMLGWVLAYRHVRRIDSVFFQPSLAGARALALYLGGDVAAAAQAYREHYRDGVAGGWSSGDPALDALLAGDLDRAAAAARTGPGGERGFLLTMGEVALERGRPDEALGFFGRALERSPDDIEALLLASLAHARRDAAGDAITVLGQALRQETPASRPTILLRMLETTGALSRRQGRERRPCLLAHFHRYLRLVDPSHAQRAVAAAEEAIRTGDRPADAYVTLGLMRDKQGQREQALAAFLKAIALEPRHAEAYRRAALIYAERGDLLNEYRIARAAFDAAPGDPVALKYLEHVLTERLGDPHETITVMQRAVEVDPGNGRAHERLAAAWSLAGHHARALGAYQAALRLQPDNPVLHEGLGGALHRLGRTEEAIVAYRRAAELGPGRYQPHTALARVYQRAQRYREAIAAYEAGLRLGEPPAREHAALCAAYHAVAELRQAADCSRQVLQRDPSNARARRLLAESGGPAAPGGEGRR
jgi:tetratricopeptide (TPR) repeat protein